MNNITLGLMLAATIATATSALNSVEAGGMKDHAMGMKKHMTAKKKNALALLWLVKMIAPLVRARIVLVLQ